MSSVLPKISQGKSQRGSSSHSSTAQTSSMDPIDTLLSLSNDSSLPAEARQKLQSAIANLQKGTRGKSASPPQNCNEITQYMESTVNGAMPLFQKFHVVSTGPRINNLHVSHSSPSGPLKKLDRRSTPAIQNPEETFKQMNEVMMQTLKFVDSIGEVEFDITNIREVDGSLMKDPERIFLCVTTSVFATFSFCTTLDLNIKKLLHFFGELYNYYTKENPYHNAIHVADSVQMLSLFLREPTVNFIFSDEELFLCFLCLLCLDVAHPGMSSDSLALINHSLISIFGDVATTQHGGLLIFLHELSRDENFLFSENSQQPASVLFSLVREVVCNVVLCSAPRLRPFLIDYLNRVTERNSVNNEDIPYLLAALVTLADSAFVLRPRKQCLYLGAKYLVEVRREAHELNRRGITHSVSCVLNTNVSDFIVGVGDTVVKPLITSVKFLVPFDLLDNLARNCDTTIKDEFQVSPLDESTSKCWTDNSSSVMDVLKRVTTHASSLDRKASKRAILNASPPRTSGTPPSLPLGAFSSTSFNLGSSVVDLEASHSRLPNRAEHYFSFLRLYDECEISGVPSSEFNGRLIFLALQLDPSYICGKAREKFGTDCSGSECADMAEFILENEEIPSTAEGIAGRVPGTNNAAVPLDDGSNTDGFLLFLMHMFSSREATQAANQATTEANEEPEDSSSTRPPSIEGDPPTPRPPQRDSPIRLPINTDSSSTIEFPSA